MADAAQPDARQWVAEMCLRERRARKEEATLIGAVAAMLDGECVQIVAASVADAERLMRTAKDMVKSFERQVALLAEQGGPCSENADAVET